MGQVLAIEVTAAAVRCLRVGGVGPLRAVRAYAERPLPTGLVVPSSTALNIRDEQALGRILAEATGPRPPRRARLVLPDRAARLHVLETDAAAPEGQELTRYLVWRLRDALPFDPREARAAAAAAANGLPGRVLAVTLVAREAIVAQYERVIGSLGLQVGHMAPAACHLFNLAARQHPEAGSGPHALLAVGQGSATLILARRGVPLYARTFCPPPTAVAEGDPAAGEPPAGAPEPLGPAGRAATAAHRLADEVARTLRHAAEKAGLAAPAGLCLAGDASGESPLAAVLEERLGIPCAALALPTGLRGARRLPAGAQAVLAAAWAAP